MEQRSLEKRENAGLTGAKPTGPNSLEQSLYGLKNGRTLGSKPKFLDSATDEVQTGYQETLAKSTAMSDSRRYWSPSHSNTSGLGERKGCFSKPKTTEDHIPSTASSDSYPSPPPYPLP